MLSRKTRGNHSNRFFLNIGLLKTQAEEMNARRQAAKAEREANKESTSPFPDAAMAKPKPGFIALEDPDENLYWDEPVQGGAR